MLPDLLKALEEAKDQVCSQCGCVYACTTRERCILAATKCWGTRTNHTRTIANTKANTHTHKHARPNTRAHKHTHTHTQNLNVEIRALAEYD